MRKSILLSWASHLFLFHLLDPHTHTHTHTHTHSHIPAPLSYLLWLFAPVSHFLALPPHFLTCKSLRSRCFHQLSASSYSVLSRSSLPSLPLSLLFSSLLISVIWLQLISTQLYRNKRKTNSMSRALQLIASNYSFIRYLLHEHCTWWDVKSKSTHSVSPSLSLSLSLSRSLL